MFKKYLNRPVWSYDLLRADQFFVGRRVLVTGAAGSIGSALMRSLARHAPLRLYGLDQDEYRLWKLRMELPFEPVLGSLGDVALPDVDVVFHCAAYKHVDAGGACASNTRTQAALKARYGRLILCSTDKAADPVNEMGQSKRACELDKAAIAVRLVNVLGSHGSVLEAWELELKLGRPLTVHGLTMSRYWMTADEAAGCLMEAAYCGLKPGIYVPPFVKERQLGEILDIFLEDHPEGSVALRGPRPQDKINEKIIGRAEYVSPVRGSVLLRVKEA